MDRPEEVVDGFDYEIPESKILVLGSGHSRVTKAYNQILKQELNIEHYFLTTAQGLIESLAFDTERDRVLYRKVLKRNLKKNIDKILIFADVGYSDEGCVKYLAKRERRKNAALKAKTDILITFKDLHPTTSVECYLITIDKNKGRVKSFERLDQVEQLQATTA